MSDPEDDHYCNDNHRARRRPCDLCLTQRGALRIRRLIAEGRPTLTHRPFATLLTELRSPQ
jgi:hypothetical protein